MLSRSGSHNNHNCSVKLYVCVFLFGGKVLDCEVVLANWLTILSLAFKSSTLFSVFLINLIYYSLYVLTRSLFGGFFLKILVNRFVKTFSQFITLSFTHSIISIVSVLSL